MTNFVSSSIGFVKKHKIIAGTTLAVLLVVGGYAVFAQRNNNNVETLTVQPKEFVREVAIAGKVIAAKDVELGFETSGKIASVSRNEGDRVTAGDVIAALSSADIQADLLKAQAELEAEQSKLAELKAGSGKVTEVYTAKRSLVNALQNAYTQSDDAVRNKVDQFYVDPLEDPEIVFAFNDYKLKQELDLKREEIERLLVNWEEESRSLTVDSVSQADIEEGKRNVRDIKLFLDRVALAVNSMEENAAVSQTEIDKYRGDVATARTNINNALNAITDGEEKVRSVESQIPYQEAKVKSAQAVIANYQAQIGKTVIRAPFSGVLARQDAKVGEIVGANTPVMSLISSGNYQIETFIPEINITDIKIGDVAKVSLDAFEDTEIFDAKVIAIDPAETVRDGVSTYKVVFEFLTVDDRFRAGMTANVDITTEKRNGVIAIPQSAVTKRDGVSYVQIKVGKELVEKQITTGDAASTGEIEVLSGLSAGENIVLDPKPLN